MQIYMPLPFTVSVDTVSSAQGPQASDGFGNSHFRDGWLQWGWDFSVTPEIYALTDGIVVAYKDSYPNEGNPPFDHGIGNYITIAYQITNEFTLYQTFGHLRQGSVTGAGIGLGPNFRVEWGDVLGVAGGSGGYEADQHVHVHFGTSFIEGSPTSDYIAGIYADGRGDRTSPVVFPDYISPWGDDPNIFGNNYTSPATFSSSGGVTFSGKSSGDAYFTTKNADVVNASGGNDYIWLRGGNDWIDGGEGYDIVYFDRPVSSYSILRTGGSIQLINEEEVVRLTRIEELKFSDNRIIKLQDLPDGSRITSYNSINKLIHQGSGNSVIVSTGAAQEISFASHLAPSSLWAGTMSLLETLRGWFIGTAEASTIKPSTAIFNTGTQVVEIDRRFETVSIEGIGAVALSDILSPTIRDDHANGHSAATVFSAGPVTNAVSASGNVGTSDDQDWFSVQLQAGMKYAFVLWPNSNSNSLLDPRLTLRTPTGATETNDNLSATTLMSFISFTAAQTGTYHLRAEGMRGTTGDYIITASPITTDTTAGGLRPQNGSTDPWNPNAIPWQWQGTPGDDAPSELTLEAGGRPQTSGNNFYRGHGGEDRIRAGGGNDVVWGDDGRDSISGEDGNDTMRGGGSSDSLRGGTGEDLLYGERGDDTITADDGNDTIYGGDDEDRLRGSDGDDYIKGEDDNDDVDGGFGNDQLYGDRGADTMEGGSGNDFMMGGSGNDVMDGDSGHDRLAGEDDDDFLFGDGGDDAIYGGDNADTLRGGEGNDILHGEGGIDWADFTDGDTGVRINLFDEVAVSTDLGIDDLYDIENVRGTREDDVIDGDHGANILDGYRANDNIRGHDGADTLFGGDGNDRLWGDLGNDVAFGDEGNDELRGGLGSDTLNGGIGNDHLRGEQGNDTVDGGDGIDTVFFWGEREDFSIIASGAGFIVSDLRTDGLEGQDVLTNIEFFEFFDGRVDASIVLAEAPVAVKDDASTTAQTLIVLDVLENDGAGTLDLVSVQILGGGAGTAYVAGNNVVFDPRGAFTGLASGTAATVNLTYTVRSEGLRTSTGAIEIFVTSVHDRLAGDSSGNELYGYAGNDTLEGGAGDDELDGGADVDRMVGGLGNDRYVVDVLQDGVIEALNQGTDTVLTGLPTYVLGANVENVTATTAIAHRFTGNALNNVITGNADSDTLIGGLGNDTLEGGGAVDWLYGGANNDTYVVEASTDRVIEGLNQGIDTVRTAAPVYSLPLNVENLVGTFAGGQRLTGNTLDNAITGFTGADTLVGGLGRDTLDGGAGIDRLFGGDGDDIYRVEATTDLVVEAAAQGIDTVIVLGGAAYTLGANLEALVLGGAAVVTGVGNTLDNTITGNAIGNVLYGLGGNDSLDGGGGIDILVGGLGQDTLMGGAGNDQFRFLAPGETTLLAPDRITDFTPGQDRIDLRFIDGAFATPLAYVAGAPVAAGQVGVVAIGGGVWQVRGDLDGGGADFAITVVSATGPSAGWFLL